MPDHDDLRGSLLELTEPRQAPADPAALVRHRVRRVRRRRHGAVAILAAATATAAVLAAGPVTGLLRPDPDRSTVTGSPTTAPTVTRPATPRPTPTYNDPALNAKLPPPWKDERFTKFPERNLYAPEGTYIARGELGGYDWYAVTHTDHKLSEGCITAEAPGASEIGFARCFDEWPAGRRASWDVEQAYGGSKPNMTPLAATFVGGAVSAEARSVQIRTAAGREYRVQAIGTPTSDKLRFFFLVVPERGARVASVRPLRADGALAGPPVGLPQNGGSCYDGPREGFPNGGGSRCITATPVR